MNTAITFDDVLLVPAYNHWESRRVVDISMSDRGGKLKLDLHCLYTPRTAAPVAVVKTWTAVPLLMIDD